MQADFRKKGCPNEVCDRRRKKIKLNAKERFCPGCGTELVFVCARCFKQIEDAGVKHRICSLCEAKAAARRAKAKEALQNALRVIPVIIPAVKKAGPAIKKGKHVVAKVVKDIPRLK